MLPPALAALCGLWLLWRLVQPYLAAGAFSLPRFGEDMLVLATAFFALALLCRLRIGRAAAVASGTALTLAALLYAALFAPRAAAWSAAGLALLLAASLVFTAAAGYGAPAALLTAILLLAAYPLLGSRTGLPGETLGPGCLLLAAALLAAGIKPPARRWPPALFPPALLLAAWFDGPSAAAAGALALLMLLAGIRLARGPLGLSGAAGLLAAAAGALLSHRTPLFAGFALSAAHAPAVDLAALYGAHALRLVCALALAGLILRFRRLDEGDVAPLAAGLGLGLLGALSGAEAPQLLLLPFAAPLAAFAASLALRRRRS
ncbi:MAG: hypothetical protein Q4C13_05000 [Clostridia bacterium]|nr:hypothetical protein [Clostridia bacterium]